MPPAMRGVARPASSLRCGRGRPPNAGYRPRCDEVARDLNGFGRERASTEARVSATIFAVFATYAAIFRCQVDDSSWRRTEPSTAASRSAHVTTLAARARSVRLESQASRHAPVVTSSTATRDFEVSAQTSCGWQLKKADKKLPPATRSPKVGPHKQNALGGAHTGGSHAASCDRSRRNEIPDLRSLTRRPDCQFAPSYSHPICRVMRPEGRVETTAAECAAYRARSRSTFSMGG